MLLTFLQNCWDSALILPEYLCLSYANKLRPTETQHVAFGKEVFPSKAIGVYMIGLIPPVIILRFKSIETSGI